MCANRSLELNQLIQPVKQIGGGSTKEIGCCLTPCLRRLPDLRRDSCFSAIAASRDGYFEALLAVLDPDVVVRADRTAVPPGTSLELRAVETVARPAFTVSRRPRFAQPALVNGAAGSSTPRVDVYPW